MSEISWKALDLPSFRELQGSTQTYSLPREKWPRWAQESTQMRRLWIYCPPVGTLMSTATTAAIVGRILTERFDRKDDPLSFNYNYHLLAESTGGLVFQSGPMRTTDPPHHSADPSTSLDAYGPPPS